jgi:hypothetical protein
VVEADVDPESGALALAGCPSRRPEFFLRGTEPVETCPTWASRDRPGAGPDGDRSLIERLFDRWLDRL